MDEKRLLKSSTRLIYSLRSLSSQTHAYWSELAHYFFHKELSLSQIRDIEIESASKPFNSEMAAASFFHSLDTDEKLWIASALKLLLTNAAATSDLKSQKQLNVFTAGILAEGSLSQSEIDKKHGELLSSFLDFKKRKKFSIPGRVALISCDYFLRWIILLVCNYAFSSKLQYPVVGNFAVSFIILGLAIYLTKEDESFNERLTKSYNLKFLFGFKYVYNTAQYSLLAFYLFSSLTISYLLFRDDGINVIIPILTAFILYYYLLLRVFPIGKLDELYLEAQIAEKSSFDYSDVDENDKRIVLLETQLNSNAGRLEAYVLESALFGALAFSAFLQIFATNLISFSDLEKFGASVYNALHGIVRANSDEFAQNYALLHNKESLFSLISIETLICSGLFVAVIASRLRFSHVADLMRTDLNLAKAYNEKEERMLEGTDFSTLTERFSNINRRIFEHLEKAGKRVLEIEPIVKYIVYFRNLGVLCFVGVLITSCLFISTALALLFVLVAVATWAYFNYRLISSSVTAFSLRLQIIFARHKYTSLVSAIIVMLLAFVSRISFGWQETNYLIAISLFSLGLYLALALVMPQHDHRFGDVDSEIWSNAKVLFATVIFFSGIALAMVPLSITWVDYILFFDFSAMFLLTFFVSYYLTKPKSLFFLWAIALFGAFQGFLFGLMNWAGAREMLIVGLIGCSLFWLVYLIRGKMFHKLFVRMMLIATVLDLMSTHTLIVYQPKITWLARGIMMYQYEVFDIDPILKYTGEIFLPLATNNVNEAEIRKSIAACDHFIKKFGTQYGLTRLHRNMIFSYEDVALNVLQSGEKPDSVSLMTAYLAIHQSEKIAALFKYQIHPDLDIHAEILKQMGRGNEVIDYYKHILNVADSESVKTWARNKIEEKQGAK
jgi:hypothetical protein